MRASSISAAVLPGRGSGVEGGAVAGLGVVEVGVGDWEGGGWWHCLRCGEGIEGRSEWS